MKAALLVEDDPISRAFLAEALSHSGWGCDSVDTGAEAIAAAIAKRFDVLILDMNLPDGDGIQVLRAIRNRDQHASADAPALALTADNDPALHARLLRNGFDAVGTKPLSMQQLARLLDGLLPGENAGPCPAPGQIGPTLHHPLDWDDAAALAAVGGNKDAVHVLRTLLLGDLPGQRNAILAAPASAEAARVMHRLRAAAGFCGAARLTQAILRLEASPHDTGAMQAFAEACDALTNQPPQPLA